MSGCPGCSPCWGQGGDPEPHLARLCEVAVDVASVNGVGVMLMVDDVPQVSLYSTGDVSARIEDLQYTLGEGPCVDAFQGGRPVLEPDLAQPVTPRWAAFTPPAIEAGVAAVFGFPLQVGAVRLGALDLYRDRSGPLTEEQHADVLVMSKVCATTILAMQASAPLDGLAGELAAAGTSYQMVVHQASGMVAVQLGVGVGDALVSLRAHAFAHDRSLVEIAEAVVMRRLRFNDDGAGAPPP